MSGIFGKEFEHYVSSRAKTRNMSLFIPSRVLVGKPNLAPFGDKARCSRNMNTSYKVHVFPVVSTRQHQGVLLILEAFLGQKF